jgi:hypothetical protein
MHLTADGMAGPMPQVGPVAAGLDVAATTSSTSKPRSVRPAAIASRTRRMPASRAPIATANARAIGSGTCAPQYAIQVMSEYTA